MTTNKKTVKKKVRQSEKKTGSSIKKKVAKKKISQKRPAFQKKKSKKDKTKKDSKIILRLDPVLVINNARSLMQEFSQLIESKEDVNIDASAVEMIDTAILQLLLVSTIKIESSNRKINWINPSDKFISSASLLGLSGPLGIM